MSATDPSSEHPPRTAPLAMWRAMGAFVTLLFNMFGDPSRIAAKIVIMQKERGLMLQWLRAGETMLRRLLLIEAAAVAPGAGARRKPAGKRPRRRHEFFAEKPEEWRVSFRCFVKAGRLPAGQRRLRQAKRFHDCWPIAERFEALLRVYNDPAAAARRLARRLRPAPYRAQAILYVPSDLSPLIGAEACAALSEAADCAYLRLNSS